ncbi:HK97 family phage prohead protease [Bacillus cereus]|uniref:HK97 family phage prohead protease n=1 Tax=Bacillus cereus TaxID=1396 RepID=UPI002ABF37F7|nr:HK97 family phage prohead protease [Bacillus cereus]MDZ4427305.1 HK97 family phage prohead protease [Bacillus cereus]
MKIKMELRTNQTSLRSDGNSLTVQGIVNVPGELSEVLGTVKQFREKIAPGAFERAIAKAKDIHFLAEHDSKQVLSSTRNGSLTLEETGEGLYMEATISPTTWGRNYYQLISDGLVRNLSFGFRALKDSWTSLDNMAIRTVEELELYEISAVVNPAYIQSSISSRSIDIVKDVNVPDLEELRKINSEY